MIQDFSALPTVNTTNILNCCIINNPILCLSVRPSVYNFLRTCAVCKTITRRVGCVNRVCNSHRQFLPRDALLSAVYAVVVCLCVCVCLSVTLRYCIKTAKRRITQTTPHDSPMTLVFWSQISWRNSNGITPYGGDECRWGRLKFVTFDEKRAITRKRYKIDG